MWKLLLKRWIFYWPVKIFASCKSHNPHQIKDLNIDPELPIVYMLQSDSISDLLTLEKYTRKNRLPNPFSSIVYCGQKLKRTTFLKKINYFFFDEKNDYPNTDTINNWLNKSQNCKIPIQIVPVTIIWNRNPYHEDETPPDFIASPRTALRKFFRLLFLGVDNVTIPSDPIITYDTKTDTVISLDKIINYCTNVFYNKHKQIIGPQLPNREKLINEIINSKTVLDTIADISDRDENQTNELKNEAKNIANEMAADISYHLVRCAASLTELIWNKFYQGISVNGAPQVRELVKQGHEIIYIPCHRSHMDYILLIYVLFREGLVSPHVVAGNNLNFFPINKLLRGCGAFFMRRKFKGDALYSAIFKEYISTLFTKGYSSEFFIEGGRSRTGRTLPPRTGLVAMAVQTVLKDCKRPITFIPTYLGYEKVMEVNNYMSELGGAQKEKESPWQLLNIYKRFKYYGRGYVSFGDPITISKFLDDNTPNWKNDITPNKWNKPSWLFETVNLLSDEIVMNLNESAIVNGLNLCALAILSDNTHKISLNKLLDIINFYLLILRNCHTFKKRTVPNIHSQALLKQALELKPFRITKNSNKEKFAEPTTKEIIYLTYFRNNILHFFVLPALIVTIIKVHKNIKAKDIIVHSRNVFYFLRHELYSPIRENILDKTISEYIKSLQLNELIICKDEFYSLSTNNEHLYLLNILSNCIHANLIRYLIGSYIIKNSEDNSLTSASFVEKCVQKSKSLPLEITNNSPEFADPVTFKVMCETLIRHKYVFVNKDDDTFTKDLLKLEKLTNAVGHLLPNEILKNI